MSKISVAAALCVMAVSVPLHAQNGRSGSYSASPFPRISRELAMAVQPLTKELITAFPMLQGVSVNDPDQLQYMAPLVWANATVEEYASHYAKDSTLIGITAWNLVHDQLPVLDIGKIRNPDTAIGDLAEIEFRLQRIGPYVPFYNGDERMRDPNATASQVPPSAIRPHIRARFGDRLNQMVRELEKQTPSRDFRDFIEEDGRIALVTALDKRPYVLPKLTAGGEYPRLGTRVPSRPRHRLIAAYLEPGTAKNLMFSDMVEVAMREPRNEKVQIRAVDSLISNMHREDENIVQTLAHISTALQRTDFAGAFESGVLRLLNLVINLENPSHWIQQERGPTASSSMIWASLGTITSGLHRLKLRSSEAIDKLEDHFLDHQVAWLPPNLQEARHDYLVFIRKKIRALQETGRFPS